MTKEKLDELAEKYQDDNTIIRYYGPGNGSVLEYNKTMAEVFKDGWSACMEQMMKEAVEGEFLYTPYPTIELDDLKDYNFTDFDKVRIIIVKED